MYPISLEFDSTILEDLKNLYRVLGYIRGANFPNVEKITVKAIGPLGWQYINALQKKHGLEVIKKLNKETINLINELFAKKQATEKITKVSPIIDKNILTDTISIKDDAISNIKTTISTIKEPSDDIPTNKVVETVPDDATTHQVVGTVRDAAWQEKAGIKIEVLERGLRDQLTLLGTGETSDKGTYQISYTPPLHPKTKVAKTTFQVVVTATFSPEEVLRQTFDKATALIQADFTAGNVAYQGRSVFEQHLDLITCVLGDLDILQLEESAKNQDISFLQTETGLQREEITQLLLAHHITAALAEYPVLSPAVIYAFIRQNSLTLSLNQTTPWATWIEEAVKEATLSLALLNLDQQERTLNNAVEANLLPIQEVLQLEEIKAQLGKLSFQKVLQTPLLQDKISLEQLLTSQNIEKELHPTIVESFSSQVQSPRSFLEELASNPAIDSATLSKIETGHQLMEMTAANLPLMEALQQPLASTKDKSIQRLSDYAKWSVENWMEFVAANEKSIPQELLADKETDAVKTYAQVLQTNTEALYPNTALVAHASRSPKIALERLEEVTNFLDDHSDFDLKTNHITHYIHQKPDLISKEAVEEIKVLKRVQNIATSATMGAALLEQKIYSAGQVYSMGQTQFTKTLSANGQFGSSQIGQAYNNATQQYAGALVIASNYSFNQLNPKAIVQITDGLLQQFDDTPQGLPNLDELFGSIDYCACQHCQSVYSPAAYFTDLLRFLGEKQSQPDEKDANGNVTQTYPIVRDLLFDRRPDLDGIDLNCQNTYTPMPYIDLVCEVLENQVELINVVNSTPGFEHNTTLEAAQLKALPEHEKEGAYLALAQLYTMHGHYNLWQSKSDLFLKHLGIDYADLIDHWNKTPNQATIAAAYFDITTVDKAFLTDQLYGGLNANGLDFLWQWKHDYSQTTTVDKDRNKRVSDFLDASHLSYAQLLELLQLEFVNSGATTIIDRPYNSCDIRQQWLKGDLTVDKFSRITRFLRLWRSTPWEMWELDLLLISSKIGNDAINDTTLTRLHKFHQLQTTLNLSVEELMAFYEPLDTTARRDAENKPILSFYERLFLNPALEADLTDFELSKITTSPINPLQASTVAAVLGVDNTPIIPLMNALSSSLGILTLTVLYQRITLSKKLGYSLEQLANLQILAVTNPFSSLENTCKLVEYHQQLQASGLAVEEAIYLLTTRPSSFQLEATTITTYWSKQEEAIVALQESLFNDDLVANGLDQTSEKLKDLLKRNLGAVLTFSNEETLSDGIDLIYNEGRWVPTYTVAAGPNAPIPIPLGTQIDNFISRYFTFVANIQLAKTILNPANNYTLEQKINYLLEQFVYHFKRQVILEQVSENLGLEENNANLLLSSLEHTNGLSYYDVLRQANAVADIEVVYYRLHKMALLIDSWQITVEELHNYVQHYNNTTLSFLFLTELPVTTGTSSASLPKLLEWWNFLQLDRQYQYEGESIANLWNLSWTDFQQQFALYLGIESTLLNNIINHFGWSSSDFKQYATLARLLDCLADQKLLGAAIDSIVSWTDRDRFVSGIPGSYFNLVSHQINTANQIQEAAKAKYTRSAWLEVLKPLQDAIRLQKRDALITYHTKSNPVYRYESTNHLFQHFLIDVEMSACQMTSRIKQAISSVQLFVQRCVMNLEAGVTLPYVDDNIHDNWEQWKWMQNYRIWEANRKVFLYPENWIEPELRDDKTPFFKEFEDELLQNDITHENVEGAFERYLQKVNEVAHLDIMGCCDGRAADGSKVMHVLARTKEMPQQYYFRTYNYDYQSWNAWEKVDVDIKGNHAIPYVFNNKVHIFWLEMLEKPNKVSKLPANEASTSPSTAPENPTYSEIQLSWSVRKTEGWTPKKISQKKLIHPWPIPSFALHIKPRFKAPLRQLWIDIFASTSREFNDTEFYNQYSGQHEKMTTVPFNETTPPSHVSSFVFDGYVKEVKLRRIEGNYLIDNKTRKLSTTKGGAYLNNGLAIIDILGISSSNTTLVYKVKTNRSDYVIQYNKITEQYTGLDVLNQAIQQQKPGFSITKLEHATLLGASNLGNGINDYLYFRIYTNTGVLYHSNKNAALDAQNNLTTIPDIYDLNIFIKPPTSITSSVGTAIDAYDYVFQNFGQEGRMHRELLDHEIANSISLTGNSIWYVGSHLEYNYITNNIKDTVINGSMLFASPIKPYKEIYLINHSADLFKHHFYQDEERALFIDWQAQNAPSITFPIYPFYHPYASMFIRQLTSGGTEQLLSRQTQSYPETIYDNGFAIGQYQPTFPNSVDGADSIKNGDIVDFSKKGAYSGYNWEIFFHIPLLVATQLSKNQRFEEAMEWFHYIFDPTNSTKELFGEVVNPPQRYWKTKPFFERGSAEYLAQQIDTILNNTGAQEVINQITEWKNNPFQPHLVARGRTVAYQRNVVMKYIDNLIAWGDQLFRRESIESINQATLLYVVASELLGERPQQIPPLNPVTKNFDEIKDDLDKFGNTDVMIAAEGLIANTANLSTTNGQSLPVITTKYFCVPNNDKLLTYWDLVEDRLFKIRHCMNIDGLVRQLPLFAPPIDPALLVKATASGLDLGSVLNDMAAPRSSYKFRVLSRTAAQFTSEVKSLGQSLLSAMQSRDAEGMALLQSSNTIKILETTAQLKELQIAETKETLASLEISKASTTIRKEFYESREFMNAGESQSLDLSIASMGTQIGGTVLDAIGSIVSLIPDFNIGISGALASPVSTVKMGGHLFGQATSIAANMAYQSANIISKESGIISQKASYQRRQEEWDLQAELATKELEQIEKQIIGAQIRLAIAEKDLDTHQLQIENAKTEGEYLKSKYTNKELYSWMVGQISTVYFQAYQLAYDMAKRAEKSFKYELALPSSSADHIKFGYWDSLKKGLLAGDKLMLDINKMESAYLEQNKREFELTKNISLRQLAPAQLLSLITTGECSIDIPEWWFDMDFAGHYMRRIKGISMSIPCIVGPYTNVNCTLSIEKHGVRSSAIVGSSYTAASADTFVSESVAISQGQNDSGLFEFNFNDERYLPFEGMGAISRWKLKLADADLAQFDYTSITDVVLHMRYTARDGGETLKSEAIAHVKDRIGAQIAAVENPAIVLSLKQQFATAWHRFIQADTTSGAHELTFQISEKHFPYFTKFGSGRTIENGKILLTTKNGSTHTSTFGLVIGNFDPVTGINSGTIQDQKDPSNSIGRGQMTDNTLNNLLVDNTDLSLDWTLTITAIDSLSGSDLQTAFEAIDDIILVLNYTV